MNKRKYFTKLNEKNGSDHIVLPRKFIMIQKALIQYEKKKFHPKIKNFRYMSTNSMSTIVKRERYNSLVNKTTNFAQKMYGPIPESFKISTPSNKQQKKQNVSSQITLASSEEKQTYIKMSKLRNKQRYKKNKQINTKKIQNQCSDKSKILIELLGQHVYIQSPRKQMQKYKEIQRKQEGFQFSHHFQLFNKSQMTLNRQVSQKKYAQIDLSQFLQNETNLTNSQKGRMSQLKRRKQSQNQQKKISNLKLKYTQNRFNINRRQNAIKKTKYLQTEYAEQINPQRQNRHIKSRNDYKFQQSLINDDQGVEFSSKGWVIAQNLDSNMITL